MWYVGLVVFNCDFPRIYVYYMSMNVALYLYMFSLFYKKTYAEKPKTDKTK